MNIASLLTPKSTVAYLTGNATIRQGLEKMRAHGYAAIPVLDEEGRYVGSVSEGDFLWHILDTNKATLKAQENCPITSILRPDWNPSVTIDVAIDDLLEQITNQNFIPVVDDRNYFIGIVTRKDVIRAFRDKLDH